MKRKGIIGWVLNPAMYARRLSIAGDHDLLKVYGDFVPPRRAGTGERLETGVARMIGPGVALAREYAEFQGIYEANEPVKLSDLYAT